MKTKHGNNNHKLTKNDMASGIMGNSIHIKQVTKIKQISQINKITCMTLSSHSTKLIIIFQQGLQTLIMFLQNI